MRCRDIKIIVFVQLDPDQNVFLHTFDQFNAVLLVWVFPYIVRFINHLLEDFQKVLGIFWVVVPNMLAKSGGLINRSAGNALACACVVLLAVRADVN